jgi:hypothetical protein
MFLILSLLLALLPLIGVVWMAFHHALTTVDGLFMSLILLAISGTLGTTVLFDLKKRLSGQAAHGAESRLQPAAASNNQDVKGKVEKVDFFEAAVGQPNKSIVSLQNGGGTPQTIVFEGDLRNALPTGRSVEIIFRKAVGYNVLLNVRYS